MISYHEALGAIRTALNKMKLEGGLPAGVQPESVGESTKVTSLGLDSSGVMSFVLFLEDVVGVELDLARVQAVDTVGELAGYLADGELLDRSKAKSADDTDPEEP